MKQIYLHELLQFTKEQTKDFFNKQLKRPFFSKHNNNLIIYPPGSIRNIIISEYGIEFFSHACYADDFLFTIERKKLYVSENKKDLWKIYDGTFVDYEFLLKLYHSFFGT